MLEEMLLVDPKPNILKCNKTKFVIINHGSLISEKLIEQWKLQEEQETSWIERDNSYLYRLDIKKLDLLDILKPDLVLLVMDTPLPNFEKQVLDKCRKLGLSVFPVLGKGSTVLIGPLERSRISGCVTCLELRWENSVLRTKLRETAKKQQYDINKFSVQFGLDQGESSELAKIIRIQLNEIIDPNSNNPLKNGSVGIFHRHGAFEWVPLLPSHNCPRCNHRPIDDSKFGEVHFQSYPIIDKESLRTKSIDHDYLSELYVHRNIGYISSISELATKGNYIRATAKIQLPNSFTQAGHGSGFSLIEARQKAILEVVERLCAVSSNNRRPVVIGSYDEIQDLAVDPALFGLHDEEFFRNTSNYFEQYSSNKNLSWIWAHSTKLKKPVLVPEQIAFYGSTRDKKRFIKESSNGCALGGCLEEASLHGIFEVLERDGFLNMWYGKLPIPELKLGDHCPDDVLEAYALVENRGYQVRLFNLSYDMDIPAILAVAIHNGEHGPRIVAGSSCHLVPYEAVKGALREMFVQVLHIDGITEKRRQEGYEMLQNPKKIQAILDHVVVASLPEAYPRWEFLLERAEDHVVHSIEDVFASTRYQLDSGDIRLILEAVLENFHEKGFDVIIVDQTTVEASQGGLFAAKALIPGMTPITFGYASRRVQGLKRVFELPYKLGYSDHVLTPEELNEHLHPFS